MQNSSPYPFLLILLLLQACLPIQSNSKTVIGSAGSHVRSSLTDKPAPHPNNLPRLAFTVIPDTETSIAEVDTSRYLNRPELSGFPKNVITEHFRIHFTTTGEDAVPGTDTNANDIPDFVEEVANAMEYVWDVEINYFGWPAPPTDNGKGGDDRYDVYLEDFSGTDYIGYAEPTLGNYIIEDNKIIEDRSAYSYFSLDKDFSEAGDKNSSLLDLMRVTTAHEFFHAIQYGFDSVEPLTWLGEASATWMEDEVFDGIDDVDYWLDPVFGSPDTCMASYGASDDDHLYAMWIYARYLSENYGHSIVQDIWFSAVDVDGYNIIRNTLEARHLNPQVVFEDFLIALLTRDFEEGQKYPTVSLEGQVRRDETFIPQDGVDKLGADFIEIRGRGNLTITLQTDQLNGIVVGIDGKQSAIFKMTDGTVSIDANDYDHLYLMVINHNEVSYDSQCEIADYQVVIGRADQVQYHPLLRSAPNFRRP